MFAKYIVRGQKVSNQKVERAKELRRHMTPEEKMLWQKLRNNQLEGFHFRRQQIIESFIVDFYCHAAGLVVEIDGAVHDNQIESDIERDQILMNRDLKVLHIANADIRRDLKAVLNRIRAACEEGASLPSPSRRGGGGEVP